MKMAKVKILIIILLVLTLVFSLFNICKNDSMNDLRKEISEDYYHQLKNSASGNIIIINNNSDLELIASEGHGNSTHPYVIEDLEVNGNGSLYCVLINNTNKFFTLKDCHLSNSTYGIYLENCSNGFILDNTICDNYISGIYIKDSLNNNISLNTVFDNGNYGICLINCNFSKIDFNTLLTNNLTGVYLNISCQNNITDNLISYHCYPIYLMSSNSCNIVQNSGYDNKYDVKEINCENNYYCLNSFIKDVIPREDNTDTSNEKSKQETRLDFTFLLLICFLLASLSFLLKTCISKYIFQKN